MGLTIPASCKIATVLVIKRHARNGANESRTKGEGLLSSQKVCYDDWKTYDGMISIFGQQAPFSKTLVLAVWPCQQVIVMATSSQLTDYLGYVNYRHRSGWNVRAQK